MYRVIIISSLYRTTEQHSTMTDSRVITEIINLLLLKISTNDKVHTLLKKNFYCATLVLIDQHNF